jgi:RHS repeat-associated protein
VVNPAEQLRYDLDGNLTNAGMVQADFDVDGDVDMPDYYNYFSACFNGANRPPKAGCPSPATDLDGDADVDQGDYSLFQACFNGANAPPKCNSAVPVRYTWDGENRLKAVEPMTPVNGVSKKVEFAYDYMNRRVQKKVYNRTSGAWVLATDQRFVYDRWNVVMVVNSSGTPQQTYTWGLDLSGLGGLRGDSGSAGIHGAGGIGRLLAVEETATEGSPKYWFFYDGNGNVGQLLQYTPGSPPTVALAGRYEYDPYGNVIGPDVDGDGQWTDDATAYALANPFRFSTKWFDTELGTGHELYYYGYRYYSPRLGRWLSRDPIGEMGGRNLYAYVRNGPENGVDPKGLASLPPSNLACCKYKKTTTTWGGCSWGFGCGTTTCKYQVTTRCRGDERHPEECCQCPGSTTTSVPTVGGSSTSTSLDGATWGACCFCTVYRARMAGYTWPDHQSLWLECPGASTRIDFWYETVHWFWGYTCGQDVVVTPGPPGSGPSGGGWTVQDQITIDCDTAQKIIDRAKKDSGDPPDYNGYQDCHWYCRNLFGEAEDGYRASCP